MGDGPANIARTAEKANDACYAGRVLAGVTVCVVLAAASAQGNPHLAVAAEQLDRLAATDALATLELAKRWPRNSTGELARVHLLRGLAHSLLSQEEAAVEAFKNALLLDPRLPPPSRWGPRVLEWWQRAARASSATAAAVATPPPAALAADAAVQAVTPPPRGLPLTRKLAIPFGVAAVGVAGLGGWSGALASNTARSAQAEPAIGQALNLQRQAEAQAQRANVAYIIASALAVSGGVLLFWPSGDAAR